MEKDSSSFRLVEIIGELKDLGVRVNGDKAGDGVWIESGETVLGVVWLILGAFGFLHC